MIMAALTLFATAQVDFRGELRETLETPVDQTFESNKRPQDVEVCIADAFTSVGVPSVLRQGDSQVLIVSFMPDGGGGVFAALTLKFDKMPMTAELRVRGKGWDDRMKARVAQCLR